MKIIHQSDTLLVADKPSGLLVHRGWANDDITALDLAHQQSGRYVYPVHRLDRGASGVLIFALDKETAANLSEQFAQNQVQKIYIALVRGVLKEEIFVDHPLPRSENSKERVPAQTHLKPLAQANGYSLIEARPHTGRLHQIRRHSKHAGHPLIGDVNYGRSEHNQHFRALGLTRLALHCQRIALEQGHWFSPLPDDFALPLIAAGFTREKLSAAGVFG